MSSLDIMLVFVTGMKLYSTCFPGEKWS